MKAGKLSTLQLEQVDGELYLLLDGVRIAKRGQPNTQQAKTWVPIEPGYTISGDLEIEVRYNGALVH